LKGALRWGMVKNQAETPIFRAHCQKVVDWVTHQAQNCRSGKCSGLGFILMDGAPICGFDPIPVSADAEEDPGGIVWYQPGQKLTAGKSLFAGLLKDSVAQRGFGGLPLFRSPETRDLTLLKRIL